MIDENEIMPFNFFKYGGIYSGEHNNMKYKIERNGEKPDFTLTAQVWRGPYASCAVSEDEITSKEFEYSEEGRMQAIQWLQTIYDERSEEWKNAPSINEVTPVIHE